MKKRSLKKRIRRLERLCYNLKKALYAFELSVVPQMAKLEKENLALRERIGEIAAKRPTAEEISDIANEVQRLLMSL